ncbi:capsular exopolysaccharide synthesis family protein [Altererythrobacter atlanticus]|uniref:non-specific protein-tyrosine kinase n=1 Tax=Croceibacterium atlanticum TaxID=1267766 RepID=A0A0F7KUD6_9SPHN|nr:AAA family ATPase [Croceibacterium atlanticum]AKH42801.1 Tyrosine-protein kinase etk [Croceibacterium atlanticum]MBB5731581.1 capsular exopolysaccharide synthesis family protein [Croceibacterium atlanticum]
MPNTETSEIAAESREAEAAQQSNALSLLPDPGLLWQVFRRNILLFFLVVSVVLGLTALFLVIQTPQYLAQASLLIQPSSDPVRTSEPGDPSGIVNADEVDTEIRLISSRLVAERAAALYADRFASPDGDRFTPAEIESLAATMSRATFVARSGQTRVVDIIAESSDPAFAATTANLIAEAYLQSQVEAKTARSESSGEFINARLEELESNAIAAQAALDNYRAARGLVSANGSTNAEMEVSNLNTQLASARAELAEKRGRYNAARSQLSRGSGGADVGAALGSSTVGSLRQQEARVSAELAVLRERYGPLHPERRQAEQELADIRDRIQEEINRVLSNLQAEVQTAQSRVASLEGSRGAALSALQRNGQAQAGLSELEQKAEAAQAIYQSFLQRSQESGALRDSALPDAVISAKAVVPQLPASPNYPLTVLIGLFLALVSGFSAILLAEYLRRGVQTKRDVERRLRLRYAGAIPSLKSTIKGRAPLEAPHDYVCNHPHSLFAEAFRSIRTFLTLSAGTRPRVIAITSALPGEGKTTTSLCLSRTTAADGIRVVLVDADLRRRGASWALEYESETDIYDYLDGTASLNDCLHVDTRTGLHLLGSKSGQEGHRNPLTEGNVRRMFDELREHYDVIIIDTAPILGVAEGRILATEADRVLLVTQWKKTSMRAVEAVSDMLVDANAKITGLALTQVNIKKYASTGDGDVYAYTKKFRGYYVD